MNVWLLGAVVLLAALVPCGVVLLRAPLLDALVAAELAGVAITLALALLAEGLHRSSYFAVALVFAASAAVGSLALVRLFGERLL